MALLVLLVLPVLQAPLLHQVLPELVIKIQVSTRIQMSTKIQVSTCTILITQISIFSTHINQGPEGPEGPVDLVVDQQARIWVDLLVRRQVSLQVNHLVNRQVNRQVRQQVQGKGHIKVRKVDRKVALSRRSNNYLTQA